MDSRDIPPPPSTHQQLQPLPGMLMSRYRNLNAAAIMGPTSTSQSIHHRLPFGSLAPRHPQDQSPQTLHQQQQKMDQKTLGFGNGSPSSHPMRLGIEQNQNQNQQQQVKKKRGRPRKYTTDGGTAGVGFTPHVIEVKTGEDIASKVMAFSDQGPRTICILSANGAVSSVTLRQASNPSETVTSKGPFDIITLSGTFLNYEVNGSTNRSGSLSVSLAGPDGRILGGSVIGSLLAATQVQVIVGSFVAEAKKPKQSTGNNAARGPNPESASAPANMLNIGLNSQGPSSESSEENQSGSSSMHRDNNNNGIYGNSVAQQQKRLSQTQMYHFWPNHGQ